MHGVIPIFFVVGKVLIVGLVTGELRHSFCGLRLLAATRLVLPLPLALLALFELADLCLSRLLSLILELQLRARLGSIWVLPIIGHLPLQLHQL